ncbi:MAG: dienelactone hydrolase family protein [Alphaproteobacteria bacterium]|nr:dienelactone hydrolase family protein [Alphaproteobacteria bacterium]TAD91691.1 MAG: dienelactone hydrolase family protein [Alphaproteobacteria bacterium]
MSLTLTAADGHVSGAYLAEPDGTPIGSLVVVQEIFGVNRHIRRVCDAWAKAGYRALAPALFDRVRPGVELGYTPDGIKQGREIRAEVPLEGALADLAAAIAYLRPAKVGVIGYCWGGTLAWLAASRLGADAAVGYYGGQIAAFGAEAPKCPVILHFGEQDGSIPMADVTLIRSKHPMLPVYVYPAGHGFNCDERDHYEPGSAKLAWTRSDQFLRAALAE